MALFLQDPFFVLQGAPCQAVAWRPLSGGSSFTDVAFAPALGWLCAAGAVFGTWGLLLLPGDKTASENYDFFLVPIMVLIILAFCLLLIPVRVLPFLDLILIPSCKNKSWTGAEMSYLVCCIVCGCAGRGGAG